MSPTTIDRCNALRERYYPREEWPGLRYEAAVAEGGRPGAVLLEIGCGREGRRLQRMASGFQLSVGIDVEVAAQLNSATRTRLILGDAHRIAMADDSVDVVATANVAEHLAQPTAVFDECMRVLKPGGRFVVMTVNQNFPPIALSRILPHRVRQMINRVATGTHLEDTFPAYYRMNTVASLASIADRTGFVTRSLAYIPHHPHYLMFSTLAYRLGVLAERALRPISSLRHMILGVFEKPASVRPSREEYRQHPVEVAAR